MKNTTNLANKTVLIKSLKKIKKYLKKNRQSVYYNKLYWNKEMAYLCGNVVRLDKDNSIYTKWTIYPWMVQAIVECPKEPVDTYFEYPLYKISSIGEIVKFSGLNTGIVVMSTDSIDIINKEVDDWISHTDESIWRDVPYNRKLGLYDKQPIWCWDNPKSSRRLSFYDTINHTTYSLSGRRDGAKYYNCEAVNFETLKANPWIIEAYNELKD